METVLKPHHPQRNSSIELYRIIATFAVLIVHFNGWFVGGMRGFDFHHPTLFGAGQMIIEALTCICVNMFLIIKQNNGNHQAKHFCSYYS
jgi:surface polysaccharide O-acyltransferase-like enzyme